MLRVMLELADLVDEQGRLPPLKGIPFEFGSAPPGQGWRFLGLTYEHLVWGWFDEGVAADGSQSPIGLPGVLEAFVRIRDEADAARLAADYGPLGVCIHGYFRSRHVYWPPFSEHMALTALDKADMAVIEDAVRRDRPWLRTRELLADALCCQFPRSADEEKLQEARRRGGEIPADLRKAIAEPVAAWLWHARRLRAVLEAVGYLRLGEAIPLGTWYRALGLPPDLPDSLHVHRPSCFGRPIVVLLETLSPYFFAADFSLAASYDLERDEPCFSVLDRSCWPWGGFLGQMALQLVSALAGRTHEILVCQGPGCGRPYAARRRPKPGERHYCPRCREEGAPERERAKRYRDRKRQGRQAGNGGQAQR